MADFSKDPASVVVGAGGSVGSQDWMKAALLLRGAGGDPMALRGEAGKALSTSAVASFIGGTIAVVLMTLFGPLLASVAVGFSPANYVALMVFAFASLA